CPRISTLFPYTTLFRSILEGGGRVLFALLADADGERVVGTVALLHEGAGVYELTKMAVASDVRGHGIGRQLLRAAVQVFEDLGRSEEHTSELQSRENLV